MRFLLSPTPDDTMETRTRDKRIVSPTAHKPEEAKAGKASLWGEEQLRLLGVQFHVKRRLDLKKILAVDNWPPELQARMSRYSL